MLRALILLLIVVLPVDLFLLVELARLTSLWVTVGLVVLTALVGLLAARVQGWLVWQKIRLDLHHGVLPADGLLEAILLLAAGVLLLTPGLLTDGIGLVLLIRGPRRAVREWIKSRLKEAIERGETVVYIAHDE